MEHDEGKEDSTAGRVSRAEEEGHDIREATLQGGVSGAYNPDAAAVDGKEKTHQQVNAVEEEGKGGGENRHR